MEFGDIGMCARARFPRVLAVGVEDRVVGIRLQGPLQSVDQLGEPQIFFHLLHHLYDLDVRTAMPRSF